MTQKCRICNRTAAEWQADSIVQHLKRQHGDHERSVRAMYSEHYDDVFGDGSVDEDAEEEDEEEDEPESGPGGSLGGTGDEFEDTYGKKWFIIGVGGAGNNIVDALLMRRDTLLRNNEDRAQIWQRGLAGYGVLNTNIFELESTYYAQEEKDYTRNDLLSNAIIGFDEHDYTGMGRRWDAGKRVMEADFTDGKNPFRDRWDMKAQNLRDAQGIIFVHSVTKGTGCGATPVLAEHIRDDVLTGDFTIEKPMLSATVLPSRSREFGGREKANGVVGMGRMSRAVDAIIPFDNSCLQDVSSDIHPRIEDVEAYNPQYAELNRPLVAFLEAFTMSSTPQGSGDRSMSIQSEGFDVADSIRPVEDKYQVDLDRDYNPAVVLAPVLGRARDAEIDRTALEILTRNALFHNKLADFDPRTAWGGSFLLYGPEDKMERVSQLVNDGTVHEILRDEEFLDAENTSGVGAVDTPVYRMTVPYLDDVYLWGTLWNPKMPSLEEMYDHAQEVKEGNSTQAENLRSVWDHVEPLFSCLGRENMA